MRTKEGNKSRLHKRQKRITRTRIMVCDSAMGWERQDRWIFHYNAATVSSSTANPPRRRIPEPKYPQRKRPRKRRQIMSILGECNDGHAYKLRAVSGVAALSLSTPDARLAPHSCTQPHTKTRLSSATC